MDKISSHVMVLGTDPNLRMPEVKKGGIAQLPVQVAGNLAGRAVANAATAPFAAGASAARGAAGTLSNNLRGMVTHPQGAARTNALLTQPQSSHWTANPAAAPILGNASLGTGAAAGALGGMLYGALSPGEYEDEQGNVHKRGILSGMARKGLLGAGLGAGVGAGLQHFVTDPRLASIPASAASGSPVSPTAPGSIKAMLGSGPETPPAYRSTPRPGMLQEGYPRE